MSIRRGLLFVVDLFVFLALVGSAAAATLTVGPASVNTDHPGKITLEISGLTAGETVLIEKFLDANQNGLVDSLEFMIQSFQVTDGRVSSIAGVRNSNVPGDEDGLVNGQIRVAIPFPLGSLLNRGAGAFLFRVVSPTGRFISVLGQLSVVPRNEPQNINGSVTAGGVAQPFALVALLEPEGDFRAGAVADANGNFSIMAEPGEYLVVAAKANFVGEFFNAPLVALEGGLSRKVSLNLVGTDRSISGKVQDSATAAGLAAIEVFLISRTGLVGLGFTDSQGNFRVPVTSGEWTFEMSTESLALLGYLGVEAEEGLVLSTIGGSFSGATFNALRTKALIAGQLKDTSTNPIAGIVFKGHDHDGNDYRTTGVTDAAGNFVLPVVGGYWHFGPDEASIQRRGFLGQHPFQSLTNSEVFSMNFVARPITLRLRGRGFAASGEPLSHLEIAGRNNSSYDSEAATDANGNFTLPLFGDTWQIEFFPEDLADMGLIGPQLSLATLDGQDRIFDLIAHPITTQIMGSVNDTAGNPIGNINVHGLAILNGTNYVVGVSTDVTGQFSLSVFNSTWKVSVNSDELSARGFQVASDQTVTISGSPGVVSFAVSRATALQINTASFPNGSTGVVYQATFQASGGQPPYAWALAPGSNALPPGLGLLADGTIQGTPTSSGFFSFTVRVSDSGGRNADKVFSINIGATGGTLEITTTSLPPGTVGISYAVQLQASGGPMPQTWALAPGSGPLPPGLGLSSVGGIQGTPTSVGRFEFTMRVTDGAEKTADRMLSITVNQPGEAPTSLVEDFQNLAAGDALKITFGEQELEFVFAEQPDPANPPNSRGQRASWSEGAANGGSILLEGSDLFARLSARVPMAGNTPVFIGILDFPAFSATFDLAGGPFQSLAQAGGVNVIGATASAKIRLPPNLPFQVFVRFLFADAKPAGAEGNEFVTANQPVPADGQWHEISVANIQRDLIPLDAGGTFSGFATRPYALEFLVSSSVASGTLQIDLDDMTLVIGGPVVTGPDVVRYGISKHQRFAQTGAVTIGPHPGDPFAFEVFIDPISPTSVNSAAVQLPGGAVRSLIKEFDGALAFEQSFAQKSSLDASYPPGAYTLTINAVRDGTKNVALNLPADAFPNPPRVENYLELQSIFPGDDTVIRWDPFVGGALNDFIEVVIGDPRTGANFFTSPAPGKPGALNGTSSSVVIPRNTLPIERTFRGMINFFKFTAADTTSYPNALGLVFFSSRTSFSAITGGNQPPVPPVILQQPQSQARATGSDVKFNVFATGTSPLAFQWQFNGNPIAGANATSLILSNVQPADAGAYTVLVSNRGGQAISPAANLIVLDPPRITVQPTNQSALPGQTVSFVVSAQGNAPLRYQWKVNGVNMPGATNATLTLPNIDASFSGSYLVSVANPVGAINSDIAKLRVSLPNLALKDNFAERVSTNAVAGAARGNNLGASREPGEPNHANKPGGKSVWYSWRAPGGGTATFGTRGSTFDTVLAVYNGTSLAQLAGIAADDDQGDFLTSKVSFRAEADVEYIIAIDGVGGATGDIVLSWAFSFGIEDIPQILAVPQSQAVFAGSNVSFSVSARAQNELAYQWFFNDTPIAGATGPVLSLSNAQAIAAGNYRVRISTSSGIVFSPAAVLEISRAPESVSQDKFFDLFTEGAPAQQLQSLSRRGKSGFSSVAAGVLGTQVLNTFGATKELGEPNHSGAIGGASRWLRLRPEQDGAMIIDTIGSEVDTVLAVYTGTDLSNLVPVAADDNSAPDGIRSLVKFSATKTTDYLVAVDAINGAQGLVMLNWQLGVPPVIDAPPLSQIVVQGGTITLTVAATNALPNPLFQWLFNGSELSGETNSLLVLTNAQPSLEGRYSVLASNALGTTASSEAEVTILVEPQFSVLNPTPQGLFQLQVTGTAGISLVIEASTNLLNWIPIFTHAPAGGAFQFADPASTNLPLRFYRARPDIF